MQKDLRDRPQFLMITDTAMVRKNGKVYAFGPVVMELAVFKQLFGSITWIGFDRPERLDDPVMMEVPEGVNCVLLKKCGGDSWKDKLQVMGRLPAMLGCILRHLPASDVVHTRAPSSPAFMGALLSYFFQRKIWWHKYAGNWAQKNPPFFYGLQRWYLSKCHWAKVTINGRWPAQPAHCLSFENPCLTQGDIDEGKKVIAQKNYRPPWRLCFVGRLEVEKGADKLAEALPMLAESGLVAQIDLVGDGAYAEAMQKLAASSPIRLVFHGFKAREEVFDIYRKSHFLVLPSRSEGFPKVIAEAANFGCIPLASAVASIPHYIRHGKEGLLWAPEQVPFGVWLQETLTQMVAMDLSAIAHKTHKMSRLFTFDRYRERITKKILFN